MESQNNLIGSQKVPESMETLQGFSGSCMVLEASEGLRGSGRDQGDLEDLGIPVGIGRVLEDL